MSAVKDWFRMTLRKEWRPKTFWKKLSGLFGVSKDGLSQYEEAHIRIQRFGMLVANKDRFIEILETRNKSRYFELCQITGLAWHPDQNSPGVEKTYIEFVECFLKEHFEHAKKQGKDALIDFFKKAFDGVCFEDRARNLEDYANKHSLSDSHTQELLQVADWSTQNPVEEAFMAEVTVLALQKGEAPTPSEFYEYLQKKGIFDTEFRVADGGGMLKPSKETYDQWAAEQVGMCILNEETDNDNKPNLR
jgi:hypothetical protein